MVSPPCTPQAPRCGVALAAPGMVALLCLLPACELLSSGGGAGGGPGGVCVPGTVVLCYSGPPETLGVGPCAGGTATCHADGTGFGPCVGEVVPAPETCLTPIDDDCDGQTNEGGAGCACLPSSVASCYAGPPGTAGVGPCAAGAMICNPEGTAFGPCAGQVLPAPETCLTPIDDDCDGQTNEGGAACACLPNSVASCYTGPAGTAGVGLCAAGTKTCLPDGTGYVACVGEVKPVAEDCATLADDDCDGSAQCAAPPLGVHAFGGPLVDEAFDIAVDAAGSFYVTGAFSDTAALGGGPVTSAGGKDVFLVKLDPSGNHLWTKTWGSPFDEGGISSSGYYKGTCVALGAAGDIYLAGMYMGGDSASPPAIDFGLGPLPGGWFPIEPFTFVTKLDPAGNAIWSEGHQLPSASADKRYVQDIAVDSVGDLLLLPVVASVETFGSIYKLDGATGGVMWQEALGLGDVGGVALDSADNVTTAWSQGSWTTTIALKKRDPTGMLLWQHLFSQGSNDWAAHDVAVIGAGDIVVVGQNHGGLDFGGGVLPGEGMFLAKLDAAGNHVWSRSIEAGSGGAVIVSGIAADAAGGFAVTGTTSAPMDFGGGMVTGTAFLVRFDGSGNQIWTKSFTHLTPTGLAISGAGRIGLSGKLLGPVDLGGGPVDTNGGTDAFVAIFGP